MESLITAEQAAAHLHFSIRRIHGLVREGKLNCVQVSARQRLFTPAQIQQFIDESKPVPAPRKLIDKSTAEKISSRPRGITGKKSTGDSSARGELRKEVRSWR